jgi:DNA polymerase III subunit beta
MKVTIDRSELTDGVAWSARALPSRPQRPDMACLLLDATGSALTVSGYDYEISAQAVLDVSRTDLAGQVLVPGKLLAEITRTLPNAPVDLELVGSALSLSCGSARFNLPTRPIVDYPKLPDLPPVSGTIPSDVFASAVASVAVAAGSDVSLPTLTGIRLEVAGDRLTLAATDRYRLAIRELSWQPVMTIDEAAALIPARTLSEAARALGGGPDVELSLASGGAGEGLLGISSGNRRTTARLLDGEFPRYRTLIPSETAASADVSSLLLAETVRRVAIVAGARSAVQLDFSDTSITVSAEGDEQAEAREDVALEAFEGEDLTIRFNASYLLDAINATGTDVIRLSFTTPNRPAVITGRGDTDYQHLLMPVRLPG